MKSELHQKLQDRAMDYLLAKSYWVKVIEMPTPMGIIDVWGLSRQKDFNTMAIEVKVSRSDFRSNSQKFKNQVAHLIANECYILCPEGLIRPEEVNENWGLLWYGEGKRLMNKKKPRFMEMDDRQKLKIMIRFLSSGINQPKKLTFPNK